MYRKLAALVLAAALLCSCSARVTVQRYPAELPRAESPAATPTPEPVPTFTEEQKAYGSAALLTDATVLVNVFLNDAAHGHTWDAESRAAAVQRTQLAIDWITEQAAGYEAAVNLICDRSADGSDSTLTRSYLVQSAMQGGENSEESSAFLDEMDTLCASLAADSRLAAYGARHIAFLFFLPISGTSFTMAHYADDGDSFYYEYSCLYKTDAYTDGEAESPATYAHEILHLFGAPDLYEGSSDPYVDEALVSYVADAYPGDIMLSTYEDDGSSRFDAITKEISPLTAYCLGLKLLSPRRCCASPLAEGGGPQGRRERAFPQAAGRHTHAGRACPAPTAVSSRGREVTPMLNDTFPLRVEAIPAAHASEWRADDSFPPSETQAWQLVFVRSGTIEERCDARHVLLRAGGLLFHQPGEVFAMTTVGEVPPETLRIDFYCTGAAMDRFRGAMLHTEPAEQHDLNWLANAANELFDAAPVPGGRPVLKEELPFGAMQQFIIHLENLLILLARRCRRTKRPVARVRRERRQNALVEDARAYFAENLAHELKIDDICTALGCTRPQLQQAFRARLHRTAMEEFSAMRIEYAAQLLARGASPGEVAAQMGYCSGAYFSQKFRAATGHTPSAYRRIQQGLPARRQNRQQKGKSESKTPIAETPQKE